MAGYHDLSDFERGLVVGAREMGHSISEVEMKFGFSRTTIARVYRDYKESGKTSNLRQMCGRKKTLKERDHRRLSRIVSRDRRATLPQIASDFNVGASTSVSVRTVQRSLHDMGIRSRRPSRVPLMTARHKAMRLAWARQHRHWTVEDWKNVAWSDESRFQLYRADGRVRVWRKPHEAMDPACQQGIVQAGGASVMVWGVCSWHALGPLVRLETTLTGARYVSILSDHLHPFMSCVHSDGLGRFQQDNATPHTSKVATTWLQEHSSEFELLRWPPKSPDMNIIEHIWDALQRAVQHRSPSPRTPSQLWTALQDSWCALPPGYLHTLVESMPRRVAAVLRAGGGPTRY
jgi:transposase